MNPTTPGQERAPEPEPEPAWQRPWSVEEIRRSCQTWSLAADAGVRGGPRAGREGPQGRRPPGGTPGLRAGGLDPDSPSTQSVPLPPVLMKPMPLALENSPLRAQASGRGRARGP